MKINIVCDEADGSWIYNQFIDQFKKYSKNKIIVNETDVNKYNIVHFLPYYTWYKTNKPSTSWQSHQEKSGTLHSKFIAVAKKVDCALSHSQKYATMLRDNHNLTNVMSIIPGVDLEKFKLRSIKRSAKTDKLVIGYIGRQYTSSNRKNPKLLDKISKLSFVEFRTTGGKLKLSDVPKFYRGLDLVVSPAVREGGPLAIQESLACGLPILCMEDVGVANEFGEGVIKAKNNDGFMVKLKQIYVEKDYTNKWRSSSYMNTLRKQVEEQTWEKFVYEHDCVWKMITTKSWKNTKGV